MADRTSRLRALERHMDADGAHSAMLTLEAIEALRVAQGFVPSYREIASARSLTIAGIQHHVKALVKANLLSVTRANRSFKVLDDKKELAWAEACTRTFNRGETRTHMDIRNAVMAALEDTLFRVDLEGSQIELVIRHRP